MAPKGKAPVQDYSQNKKLPVGQPFRMHEGASFGVKPSKATSLQRDVPAKVTYSNGDIKLLYRKFWLEIYNSTMVST